MYKHLVLTRHAIGSANAQLLIISIIPLVFGALGLLYSFSGLLQEGGNNNNFPVQPFQGLTVQEIGGHFVFGYVVALPSRNLKIGVIAGLMALTMDFDHILNATGFNLEGRLDHSIPFAILSSILMGLFVSRFFNILSSTRPNQVLSYVSRHSIKIQDSKKNHNAILTDKIFSQFVLITLAAFVSHIAYDVFVDDQASFPLLAPFSFDEFSIPTIYALPLEAIGVLMIYFYYVGYYEHLFKSRLGIAIKDEK